MSKVGVVVTGGTIAATRDGDGLFAPRCGSELLAMTEQLGREHGYSVTIERWQNSQGEPQALVDSCDVGSDHWLALSAQVDRLLDDHQGVVILHGTDTMAYTAAAMAMFGPRRRGTVVVTGAQIPLVEVGSDAEANLTLALDTAAGQHGLFDGDTLVAFGGRLMRGVSVRKHSTVDFAGFRSWNAPEFLVAASAEAGAEVNRHWRRLRSTGTAPAIRAIDPRVIHLKAHAGMAYRALSEALLAAPPAGVLVELFGVGSAPSASELGDLAKKLDRCGTLVAGISACPHGGVDWNQYESTAPLRDSPMLDGGRMTPEAAVVKLMGAAAYVGEIGERRSYFAASITGEAGHA